MGASQMSLSASGAFGLCHPAYRVKSEYKALYALLYFECVYLLLEAKN